MSTANEEYTKRAIRAYGSENQVNQAQEECGELISVLNQHRRGRCTTFEVLAEMADVEIMLDQLKVIFGEESFHLKKMEKIERLEQRLDEWESGKAFRKLDVTK